MRLLNLCLYVATVMYNYRNACVKVAYDSFDNKRRHDDDDDDMMTQTGLSCRVWRAGGVNWALMIAPGNLLQSFMLQQTVISLVPIARIVVPLPCSSALPL